MQINLHLPLAHLHATSLFKCLIRLRFTSLHWNTFYFHWITTKENLQQLLIFCNNCILNGSNVYFDLWFIFLYNFNHAPNSVAAPLTVKRAASNINCSPSWHWNMLYAAPSQGNWIGAGKFIHRQLLVSKEFSSYTKSEKGKSDIQINEHALKCSDFNTPGMYWEDKTQHSTTIQLLYFEFIWHQ